MNAQIDFDFSAKGKDGLRDPRPAGLSDEEWAVLNMIRRGGNCTQLQMARELHVGFHKKHEAHLHPFNAESTTRKVRQIVRNLRLNHGQKILSDRNGYWICQSDDEAKAYLERVERTARAQAKAHMVTYRMMEKLFGLKSEYFESLPAA